MGERRKQMPARRVRWKNSLSGFPACPATPPQSRAALIHRWVDEAADQFTDARVQVFVPILVEHIVRGQLSKLRADRDARSTRRTAPSPQVS